LGLGQAIALWAGVSPSLRLRQVREKLTIDISKRGANLLVGEENVARAGV